MEKVWFALRQTHYPAPDVATLGTANETGPILLGHVIPSLKQLDFVVNRGSILSFPLSMPVYTTAEIDASRSNKASDGVEGSVSALVPTPSGISVGGTAAGAFKRSVANSWAFGQLDTYIVQPTESYVRNIVEHEAVKIWIEKQKFLGNWSIYMITGIMVARAATFCKSETGEWSIAGGPKVSLPATVEAELQAKLSRKTELASAGKLTTDIVWAIRLAKISRHLKNIILQNDWSIKVFTDGATHSTDSDFDVQAVLLEEDVKADVIEDEDLDRAFVL